MIIHISERCVPNHFCRSKALTFILCRLLIIDMCVLMVRSQVSMKQWPIHIDDESSDTLLMAMNAACLT